MATSAEKAAGSGTAVEKPAEKVVDKRRALGRGLESLLGGPRAVATPSPVPAALAAAASEANGGVIAEAQAARASVGDTVQSVPLDSIDKNPYQTRLYFDQDALQELADSIAATGLAQPIVVRPGQGGRYVLILGERRCRASKLAGKETIPAIVRRVSDQQAAEMTVVENLQRQDLNCMEQASAFGKLSRDFELTQEQIGKRVGVSRESVANYMRLLKLPGTVMQYLQAGQLDFSHARTLLRLNDNDLIAKIADQAVAKHMSGMQLEDLVDDISMNIHRGPDESQPGRARWVDPNVRAAQMQLERVLGLRVRIRDRKGKGKIVIEYSTVDDYDRLVAMLRGKT
ncbi:MAG TPA: ParB/RepB/Spo0J family partition protein [Terriglobales bacterium]|jgi:ParB family chromosome partitioning protein|nr:ParB/RepB/Spo0J family partition protein [Terriglobales bacterium]